MAAYSYPILLLASLSATCFHYVHANQKVAYTRVYELKETVYVDDSSLLFGMQNENSAMMIIAVSNGCQCSLQNKSCSCCATFFMNSVCANVQYIPTLLGLHMSITFNGNTVFETNITMTNPPPLCVNVPFLPKLAQACLIFYNLQFGKWQFQGCSRVQFTFAGVTKQLELGCFSLGPFDPLEESLEGPAGSTHHELGVSELNGMEQKTDDNHNLLFLAESEAREQLKLFLAKLFRGARPYDRKL